VAVFGPYDATVNSLHDGDTFELDVILDRRSRATIARPDVDLGFGVHRTLHGLVWRGACRLFGCNANELRTDAGKAALAHLQTLLALGARITVNSHGWDKFGGRFDGAVTLGDGRDLAATMIADGFAKPWNGVGTKPV
jgi:endonuclease YncB( thermonuclease family)